MTRFTSFFERPLVGIFTAIGSFVTQPVGAIIEATQPVIGYITIVCGAVTALCIAGLWLRKAARTLIGDIRKRSITHDPHPKTTKPPFSLD